MVVTTRRVVKGTCRANWVLQKPRVTAVTMIGEFAGNFFVNSRTKRTFKIVKEVLKIKHHGSDGCFDRGYLSEMTLKRL